MLSMTCQGPDTLCARAGHPRSSRRSAPRSRRPESSRNHVPASATADRRHPVMLWQEANRQAPKYRDVSPAILQARVAMLRYNLMVPLPSCAEPYQRHLALTRTAATAHSSIVGHSPGHWRGLNELAEFTGLAKSSATGPSRNGMKCHCKSSGWPPFIGLCSFILRQIDQLHFPRCHAQIQKSQRYG